MRSIDELAKCLTTYNKVGAFGLLFSESAAIDFQYKLALCGESLLLLIKVISNKSNS